jgi:8-oxo-dGTP pyrophosphatase MutT (NUDIX family)
MVVVSRPGAAGREFLVLERSPEQQGYWHLVAGALEWGEEAAAAATRELREETGLVALVEDLGLRLTYALAEEPPEVRARFAAGIGEIRLYGFAAEAPAGWDPVLDWEHVGHRWLPAGEAVALLRYPEPQEAVREAARRLEAP